MLSLLLAVVLQVTPGETLFVQASSLNLRAKPKASGAIRTQVPIGSACSVVAEAPEGWVELECDRTRGFGKLDLLAPTAPDAEQFLTRGQAPGLPLAEAMNLLQRALTLKPKDEATRQAFRDLYWKAEFDRLARARAAGDTLKGAQPVSWPEGCASAEACVKAALGSEPGTVWEETRREGDSVLLARLYADGLFQLRSAALDEGQRTVTVQLESLTTPGPAVLGALGVKEDVEDACQAPMTGDNNTCGYSYEQSCAPDDCEGPKDTCRQEAANRCDECKGDCAGSCDSCRMKCGSQDRKGCVARCLASTRACEAKCQRPADAGYAVCEAQYARCAELVQREWKRTCEAPCNRVHECVKHCQDEGKVGTWQCVDRCDNRLPESCRRDCLFGYQ